MTHAGLREQVREANAALVTLGTDVAEAVANAIALDAVAAMGYRTLALEPDARPIGEALLERHFGRKHGPGAYDGQSVRDG